jgi:hypothetical protein
MKKRYVVLDWYEDLYDPYYIGEYDTEAEAEAAADDFEAETDGECDVIIYDRNAEKSAKVLKNVGI